MDQFEPSSGNKFLSYAAPANINDMPDAIATAQYRFEGRYASVLLWLEEGWRSLSCFVADPYQQPPEQIFLQKENIREVRTWMLFRFGFTDDTEHSVAETAGCF